MNWKPLFYGALIAFGLFDTILNLFVYLVNHWTDSLLHTGVGILILIGGIVMLRREMRT